MLYFICSYIQEKKLMPVHIDRPAKDIYNIRMEAGMNGI